MGRWLEALSEHLADCRAGDVADVAGSGLKGLDLDRIDIEAQHGEARFGEGTGQRQADVAQPNNADPRAAVGDAGGQFSGGS